MRNKIILFVLQLLRNLPESDTNIYTDEELASAIASYAEGEGIISFLEENSSLPVEVINRFLELRFANIKAMSFQSARYYLLKWQVIKMLWNEASVVRQKAPVMSPSELAQEKQRIQDLCASLGSDRLSLQYSNEIVNYALSIGQ